MAVAAIRLFESCLCVKAPNVEKSVLDEAVLNLAAQIAFSGERGRSV
jgi:hypothetical protein